MSVLAGTAVAAAASGARSVPASRTASATGSFSTTPLFSDDFNGAAINRANWSVYNSSTPPRFHLASNVVLRNGVLSLKTTVNTATHKWSTAGICLCQRPTFFQTYGKYLMRARFSAGDSRVVALLWPKVGWPPEIDWVEMGATGAAGARRELHQNLHWGSTNNIVHTKNSVNMTAWHTIGLEWSPGLVLYTLDGKVVNRVASSHVSSQTMWMGLSTSPDKQHAPTRSSNFDIDWIRVYAYHR